LSPGSRQGKEKEQHIIDKTYQIVVKQKETLRKIKEIKSFFQELSSLSSSSSSSFQQPNIIISLGQTPIIGAISPPVVTILPFEPTPRSPAPLPQEQEQKKMIIKLGTDFITNLFITSTLAQKSFTGD
jgi:hypothetical protein